MEMDKSTLAHCRAVYEVYGPIADDEIPREKKRWMRRRNKAARVLERLGYVKPENLTDEQREKFCRAVGRSLWALIWECEAVHTAAAIKCGGKRPPADMLLAIVQEQILQQALPDVAESINSNLTAGRRRRKRRAKVN